MSKDSKAIKYWKKVQKYCRSKSSCAHCAFNISYSDTGNLGHVHRCLFNEHPSDMLPFEDENDEFNFNDI